MCGGRKLTHTAYANQRMTLARKLRQSIMSKRNTMIALRGSIHVACFHHSCFDKGVWRCLLADVVIGNTPLFFSATVEWRLFCGKGAPALDVVQHV